MRLIRQILCWFFGHKPIRMPVRDHHGADNLLHWWNEDGVPIFKVQLCGRCHILWWAAIGPEEAMEMIEEARRGKLRRGEHP